MAFHDGQAPAAHQIYPAVLLIDMVCQVLNITPLWLSLFQSTREVLSKVAANLSLPEIDRKEEAFISLKVSA